MWKRSSSPGNDILAVFSIVHKATLRLVIGQYHEPFTKSNVQSSVPTTEIPNFSRIVDSKLDLKEDDRFSSELR
jgi:hypothetical protein